MTIEQIRAEMALIREIKRTDVDEAREKWKALRDRVKLHGERNNLPMMWRTELEKVLTEI